MRRSMMSYLLMLLLQNKLTTSWPFLVKTRSPLWTPPQKEKKLLPLRTTKKVIRKKTRRPQSPILFPSMILSDYTFVKWEPFLFLPEKAKWQLPNELKQDKMKFFRLWPIVGSLFESLYLWLIRSKRGRSKFSISFKQRSLKKEKRLREKRKLKTFRSGLEHSKLNAKNSKSLIFE